MSEESKARSLLWSWLVIATVVAVVLPIGFVLTAPAATRVSANSAGLGIPPIPTPSAGALPSLSGQYKSFLYVARDVKGADPGKRCRTTRVRTSVLTLHLGAKQTGMQLSQRPERWHARSPKRQYAIESLFPLGLDQVKRRACRRTRVNFPIGTTGGADRAGGRHPDRWRGPRLPGRRHRR